MKNLRLAVAASIAVVFTALSSGAAYAYPDSPNITLSIPDSILVGGNTVTFTGKADVDCDWTVTYADGRADGVPANQTGSGKSISGSYVTRTVDKTFKSPITATCTYDPSQGASAASAAGPAAKDATASTSATITLLARDTSGGSDSGDGDANGALPDTGGSNVWILVLGGALVVAGGGAVVASRRRHASR